MTAAGATLAAPRRSAPRELIAAIGTIMQKELRSRMRGRRAFIVLTVYLAILALITYGVYVVIAPNARNVGGFGLANANASALIGQTVFSALSIFQLILVSFIAPAFTAGQISLEREKQTLDLLVTTPMRPAAIVLGKLAAALAFVVLMIVAALPIVAIVLMYGGASIDDLVRQQVILLATALALGTVGLFYSALLKRTQAATVLTYITMLVLTLGTLMIFAFWTIVANQTDDGVGFGRPRVAPEQILYLNPGVAMLDVISTTEPGGGFGIASFLSQIRGESLGFEGEMRCLGDVCEEVDVLGNPVGDGDPSGYWWPRVAITYVIGATILTIASMRLVVPAGMRWALRRRREPAAAAATDAPIIEELDS
jgi:ABC-2 type transport system permease protein